MILLDAKGPAPEVALVPNGIMVIFRAIHPLSHEVCTSVVIELSVHNALLLSEQLHQLAIAAIDRASDQRTLASITPLRQSAGANEG